MRFLQTQLAPGLAQFSSLGWEGERHRGPGCVQALAAEGNKAPGRTSGGVEPPSQRMRIPTPWMACCIPVEAGSVLTRRRHTLNPINIPLSCSLCGHADPVISCLWWLMAKLHTLQPVGVRGMDPCPGRLGSGNQECSAQLGWQGPVNPSEPFPLGQHRERC